MNKTTWSTKDLIKLFDLVCKNEGYTPRKIVIVYGRSLIKYSENDLYINIGGRGTYYTGWVKLMLPNTKLIYNYETGKHRRETLKFLDGEIVKRVAQVLAHEIGHNRGLHHKDMMRSRNINVDYIDGAVIHRNVKTKKNVDVIQKKYNNILKLMKQWESKAKRAETFLKKYRRQKNYYEKKYPARIKKD